MSCDICVNTKFNANSFKIIKKCNCNFKTKIDEALLIKKYNPELNRQLFANESSFLVEYILDCYFVIWILRGVLAWRLLFSICIFKSINAPRDLTINFVTNCTDRNLIMLFLRKLK